MHEHALRIAQETSDLLSEGITCGNLGNNYQAQGHVDRALEMHQKNLHIAETLGNRQSARVAKGNIALCYRTMGEQYRVQGLSEQAVCNLTEAINWYDQQLQIRSELMDKAGVEAATKNIVYCRDQIGQLTRGEEVQRLADLGHHSKKEGQYTNAIALYEQALVILKEVGSLTGGGRTCNNLGLCYQGLGRLDKAIELHEQGMQMGDEVGNRRDATIARDNIGTCYEKLGNYEKAITLHEQVRSIAKEAGDQEEQGRACNKIGKCYQSLGNYDKAIELHEKCRMMGDRENQGSACGNLGLCYDALSQYDNAIKLHKQCLEIMEELGNRSHQASSCNNIGVCFKSMGQYDKAIKWYEQAQAIFLAEEVCDRAVLAVLHGNLGNCYSNLGHYTKALELVEQARLIAEEVDDQALHGQMCGNLGNIFSQLGQHDLAIAQHKQAREILAKVDNRNLLGKACGNLANCYKHLGHIDLAITMYDECQMISDELGNRADQGATYTNMGCCYQAKGLVEKAITLYEQGLAIAEEVNNRRGQIIACTNLGSIYSELYQVDKAVGLHERARAIAVEVGDRAQQGVACKNLGSCYIKWGRYTAAIGVLEQGRTMLEEVERNVGAHDDRRVSLFEQQQLTYQLLQNALLSYGEPGWALGVADQAKARALSYRLKVNSSNITADGGTHTDSWKHADKMYKGWWTEMKEMACAEGSTTRIVEFSFLNENTLVAWVLSGTGELLFVATLGESKRRTIQQLLAEARFSMNVRGRDDIISSAKTRTTDLPDLSTEQEAVLSVTTPTWVAPIGQVKENAGANLAPASETALLQEIYLMLLQPIKEFLVGAKELLIVPHKELFQVPWAALIDADGQYLIECFVIRVTPSLQVAAQAAENVRQHYAEKPGHIVLIGNPLPIPEHFRTLPQAAEEAKKIEEVLNGANMEVNQKHYFLGARNPKATKSRVKQSLQGASWAHFACHGDLETDSLVLAIPSANDVVFSNTEDNLISNLSMNEIQGIDAMEGLKNGQIAKGVKLSRGATVVLSACNSGRGEIKAEGVVGLARGFLMANAAATVMSLWSVRCFDLCCM